jgi:PAS domain S-box-containing protein
MCDIAIEYRYQTLWKSMSEGAVLLEGERIRDANPTFRKWCGHRSDDVIGLPISQFVRTDATMDRLFHSVPGDRRDAAVRAEDGEEIPVRMTSVPPENGGGKRLLLFQDLRFQAEQERMLLKHRHLETIVALSGGIAHDYNNLLTAILGNLSLAIADLDSDHPLFGPLDQAQAAALVAKDLTRRLITFSRGGSPQKEAFHLGPLVEGAVRFALSGSGCVADFSFPPDLWMVEADKSQVGQAIHNIVINAREAMAGGGIVRVEGANQRLESRRYGLVPGRYVRIAVQDEGEGIPERLLPMVFDPYFSTKPMADCRGAGLGLSIANSIIARHGGAVSVDSRLACGTRVNIFLPATTGRASDSRNGVETETSGDLSGWGRVLVMDDEEMILDLAGNALRRLGYEPVFARNGEEALERYAVATAEGRPFDVVILDLTVRGGMGGMETMSRLSAIDPAVTAVVSSGYSEDPVVRDHARYGFAGVVEKPYRIQDLGRRLKDLLSGKEKGSASALSRKDPEILTPETDPTKRR